MLGFGGSGGGGGKGATLATGSLPSTTVFKFKL